MSYNCIRFAYHYLLHLTLYHLCIPCSQQSLLYHKYNNLQYLKQRTRKHIQCKQQFLYQNPSHRYDNFMGMVNRIFASIVTLSLIKLTTHSLACKISIHLLCCNRHIHQRTDYKLQTLINRNQQRMFDTHFYLNKFNKEINIVSIDLCQDHQHAKGICQRHSWCIYYLTGIKNMKSDMLNKNFQIEKIQKHMMNIRYEMYRMNNFFGIVHIDLCHSENILDGNFGNYLDSDKYYSFLDIYYKIFHQDNMQMSKGYIYYLCNQNSSQLNTFRTDYWKCNILARILYNDHHLGMRGKKLDKGYTQMLQYLNKIRLSKYHIYKNFQYMFNTQGNIQNIDFDYCMRFDFDNSNILQDRVHKMQQYRLLREKFLGNNQCILILRYILSNLAEHKGHMQLN